MFWIKFFLMILLWLVAAPISLLASVICKLGKPPELIPYYAKPSQADHYRVSDYAETGDGPKFMGLGYYTTEREDTWRFLSSLVRGGTFWRTPSMMDDLPVFSGDQMAGFALALWKRWEAGKLTLGEYGDIKQAFDRAFFKGVPLVMTNHVGEWTVGRGWLWCPWEPCGGSTFAAATLTTLLSKIYPKDYRYAVVAFALRALAKVFIWSADFNFFFGRVYMLTMYAAHSLGCYAVLAKHIGYADGDYVLGQLHARYPWNPDFETDPKRAAALRSATRKEYFGHVFTKKWFSVRSLRWKTMAATAVAASQRLGGNYVWEENPLVPSEHSGKDQVEFVWQPNFMQVK